MKTKYLWIVVALVTMVSGCKVMDKIGNAIYDPVVSTNTFMTNIVSRVPKVITLENGLTHTNWVDEVQEVPVTLVSTNSWVLNPGIENSIKLFGDVAPLPWAGTASWLAVSILGVGSHLMGRKFKKAALEGITVAHDARERLKRVAPEEAEAVKNAAVTRQTASGIKSTVVKLLALVK
jgi:hypothetical protein